MMEQFPENNVGQVPENNVGQEDSSAAIPAVSLGKTLREAREHLGMSVADVSGQIKFAVRQIEALEADDFKRLPEMPFVRGFVRSYTRLLHLDAQQLLAYLPNADPVKLMPTPIEEPFYSIYFPQRQNLIMMGAALLTVLLAAFALWHFIMPPAQVETTVGLPGRIEGIPASPVREVAALSSTPAAQLVAVQAMAASTINTYDEPQAVKPGVQIEPQLRLAFDAESWSEIRDKDGRILSAQNNQRGSELRLNGQLPFSLAIDNAASVRFYLNGNQVDLTPYINSSSGVARLTLK